MNSAQIKEVIANVEEATGRQFSQWEKQDIEKAVGEVQNAGGDVKVFLSDIAKNNPTARTVEADIQDVLNAAKSAYEAAKHVAEDVVSDVETLCETEPSCGIPPP